VTRAFFAGLYMLQGRLRQVTRERVELGAVLRLSQVSDLDCHDRAFVRAPQTDWRARRRARPTGPAIGSGPVRLGIVEMWLGEGIRSQPELA
jgi:hypothetical protein